MYITCRHVHYHNTAKGNQGGGFKLFTYTHGCTQRSLTMANHLILNNLPFVNVSDNAWLDNCRPHNNYYDINNLPSSNNDILTDIDPDINNLVPNGCKKINAKVMIHQIKLERIYAFKITLQCFIQIFADQPKK